MEAVVVAFIGAAATIIAAVITARTQFSHRSAPDQAAKPPTKGPAQLANRHEQQGDGTVEARWLVTKPAKTLLTTGICGLTFSLMGFFAWGFLYIGAAVTLAKYNLPSPTQSNIERINFPWEEYWKARDQVHQSQLLMISHLILATAFGVAGVAGWSMLRLRRYWLCIAGSIVVMPATLCLLIGIPIGIWSLMTLRNPEVRSAFR